MARARATRSDISFNHHGQEGLTRRGSSPSERLAILIRGFCPRVSFGISAASAVWNCDSGFQKTTRRVVDAVTSQPRNFSFLLITEHATTVIEYNIHADSRDNCRDEISMGEGRGKTCRLGF